MVTLDPVCFGNKKNVGLSGVKEDRPAAYVFCICAEDQANNQYSDEIEPLSKGFLYSLVKAKFDRTTAVREEAR